MKKVRFFIIGSTLYTTSSEIGNFLISNGINIPSDAYGSYHFGTFLNSLISTYIRKGCLAGSDSVDCTKDDFPKLLDVPENKDIIKYLISKGMCNNSTVAKTKPGKNTRAVDLYTFNLFNRFLECHSIPYTMDIWEDLKVNFTKARLIHTEREDLKDSSALFSHKLF